MICQFCGCEYPEIRSQSLRTCGKLSCISELHTRAQKATWANPERRAAQSRRILAAKKAMRLLDEVLKASRAKKVTIQ